MKKPSVTELIQLLDKPALLSWANKLGLQGKKLEDERQKYLSRGTSLHKQIENYHLMAQDFEDMDFQQRYIEFMSDKHIISIEKKIETEHYQGRLDTYFVWNGDYYVADFKTNQSNIYLENKLQLVAYKKALMNCNKMAIISIPDLKIIPVDIKDTKPYEEILTALSVIYNNKLLL